VTSFFLRHPRNARARVKKDEKKDKKVLTRQIDCDIIIGRLGAGNPKNGNKERTKSPKLRSNFSIEETNGVAERHFNESTLKIKQRFERSFY